MSDALFIGAPVKGRLASMPYPNVCARMCMLEESKGEKKLVRVCARAYCECVDGRAR